EGGSEMTIKYEVHPHAKQRITKRFGIKPEHVTNWANQILSNSIEAYTAYEGAYNGRTVFQHRTKEVFLAVDVKDNLVVSVIDKPIEKVKIRSQFMDGILPNLERERHNMKREYSRKKQAMEIVHDEKRSKGATEAELLEMEREASLLMHEYTLAEAK